MAKSKSKYAVSSWIIAIIVGIIWIGMGFSLFMVYHNSTNDKPSNFNVTATGRTVTIGNIYNGDTIGNSKIVRLDQQIDSLALETSIIKSNQDNVINDIRQETNNIINKLNGWLGFWIATSALLSIIVPIICQYFVTVNFRKEIEHQIDDSIRQATQQFEKEISNFREEINKYKKEADEVRDELNSLQRKIDIARLQALLAQYRIGNDCNMLQTGITLFPALHWGESLNNFEEIFRSKLNKNNYPLSITDRHDLQKVLLQMSGFLIEINWHVDRSNRRDYIKSDKIIRSLFSKLENGTYGSVENLLNEFEDLLKCLRPLLANKK